MTIYTTEDFESFERVNDTILCPTGDYSGIKIFGNNCKFGERCKFGDTSDFGENSNFGDSCEFGERCIFKNNCSFGERNNFGEWCIFSGSCGFDERCNFRRYCNFGSDCGFGERCKFGEWCEFEENCKFGNSCEFENNGVAKTTTPFITTSGGSANRTSYAFNLENGIFVRSGCFFGTLEQFEDAVILTHGDNIHGKTYLMWVEIIKINF